MRHFVVFGFLVWSLCVPFLGAHAPTHPDFSGTWRWTSRRMPYPLVIRQTADELTLETRGLPQGPPTETFRLDGVLKTTVLEEDGYWRRYDTSSRWEGDVFIGVAKAKAGWAKERSPDGADMALPHTICTRTLRLGLNRHTLTIESACTSPEQGDATADHMVETAHLSRVRD